MGDGISFLSWVMGWDFPTTAGKLSDYLGVPPIPSTNGDGKRKKKEHKPDDHLGGSPGIASRSALWLLRKPGLTLESMQAAGGRTRSLRLLVEDLGHYETNVLAVPIYSPPQLACRRTHGLHHLEYLRRQRRPAS